MAQGKVKWYNETKGYGFIASDEGKDVFVHRTGLSNPNEVLQVDQQVTFEVKPSDKGPIATNVKTI